MKKFEEFLTKVRGLPVIESESVSHLFSYSSRNALEVQLVRWVRQGKLVRLRRGIYLLAGPYRKTEPDPLFLASLLERPSYISAEKALEYYDLIPEGIPVLTSVTPSRTGRYETPAGIFDYRHIQPSLFWGYQGVTREPGQTAFVAEPEKALLDFLYLRRERVTEDFIEGLRLQNLEKIRKGKLRQFAARFARPGLERAARLIGEYAARVKRSEKIL